MLIDRIGHRGDGIAESAAGPVYVPFTLPGERVTIMREPGGDRGLLVSLDSASPDRVKPLCRHFGPPPAAPLPDAHHCEAMCGGCALQMMTLEKNRELKRRFVADALAARGIGMPEDTIVEPAIGCEAGQRRRAVLAARRTEGGMLLGYHRRGSNRIVDIAECPVLVPEIADRLEALRALLAMLDMKRRPVRITVLAAGNGLDIDIADIAPLKRADAKRQARLVTLCRQNGIARLTVAGELAVQLAEPELEVAGVTVRPRPGAFVQAAGSAEAAMSALICGHLGECRAVADLFSGFGTFALALARTAKVHAVEADAAALETLQQALRHAAGLKPVTRERRDILRFPLGGSELRSFDGAVFDPPRAGAAAQAAELAAAGVREIAAVSCNPATFARDIRILIDGGLRPERIVPVDQFVYSAETEIVGLFSR